ncbi:MAG TPA: pitrilysin family protein [Bryobacteraceae bacterium]|nr:pitrilysin family protein [Bryobacteraceae bacterium]
MKFALLLLLATAAGAQMRVAALPSKSPLVTFRIVFTNGSASDPVDKPGVAYLTAMMLAHGGSRDLAYQQILDAMFPMAASLNAQVDKEMSSFSGAAHVDNLQAYYKLVRAMLLDPGWRADDFQRVKDDAINFLRVGLRGNNDEELAKEVLETTMFQGTSYGHYAVGTVSSLQKITLDDLKNFYHSQYTQSNLILGIAGGYSPQFLEQMKKDFRALPEKSGFRPRDKKLTTIEHNRAVLIEKPARSVAISLGFPTIVIRSQPDFVPLLVATSYLGQHRAFSGLLFQRMREQRGLNYGDYAYLEYFPRGMFQLEPSPNLVRRFGVFQIWIRPVEPPNGVFALRLALYELSQFIQQGIPEDGFERTREFLAKHVNVLTQTKSAELGYAIDSMYYGMPPYPEYLKARLAKLTRDEVNQAIRRYLRADKLIIVAVTGQAEDLKRQLTSDAPSPITYNSPKPPEVLAEDKTVASFPLHLRPEDVTIEPVDHVFE